MSAYWDWVASGGSEDTSSWGTDSDAYGDWGDPSTWVLPDTDVLDQITGFISEYGGQALDLLSGAFRRPASEGGGIDWRAIATAGGALLPLLSGGSSSSRPSGYQGSIPQYTAVREQVPQTYDPNRRPGSGGLRYFTDVQYTPRTGEGAAEALAAAQAAAEEQGAGIASLNAASPLNAPPAAYQPPAQQTPPPAQPTYDESYSGANVLKTVQGMLGGNSMAKGGVVGLQPGGFVFPADLVSHVGNGSSDAGMQYLAKRFGAAPIRGRGDGMSDSNRATIGGQQPAAVAHEEMYMPPDRVEQAGGPEALYAMMDKVRKARTGTTKQGRQINPDKFMPRSANV